MHSTSTRFIESSTNRYAGVLACVFAFILSLSLLPGIAFGDVRNSDVIRGNTIASQGYTVADCPNITAEYAYVVSEDGTVYFERGADTQTKIASITKVMTALVALDYGDLKNTKITVSAAAAAIGESSATLIEGDTLDLETALKALMICSGNDAAQAIAESMGPTILEQIKADDSIAEEDRPSNGYDAFIWAMNKKASELGMVDSHFANPHGLDFGQYQGDMYSSAHDVSRMCAEAMKNDTFRSIVSTDKATIQVARSGASADIVLESTDTLLNTYKGACGIKTGYTEQAGACFAGACERDGEMLYAIVLKSSTEAQRFVDVQALYDWVYNHTIDYSLVHSSQTTSYESDGQTHTVPVVAEVSNKAWIDKTFKATLSDPQAAVRIFTLEGNVSQQMEFDDVSSDVHVGQKVGQVKFLQNNEVIATADIVAAEESAGPNFFEGVGIWWDRLFRGFSGEPTEAENVIVNTTPLVYGSNASLKAS